MPTRVLNPWSCTPLTTTLPTGPRRPTKLRKLTTVNNNRVTVRNVVERSWILVKRGDESVEICVNYSSANQQFCFGASTLSHAEHRPSLVPLPPIISRLHCKNVEWANSWRLHLKPETKVHIQLYSLLAACTTHAINLSWQQNAPNDL